MRSLTTLLALALLLASSASAVGQSPQPTFTQPTASVAPAAGNRHVIQVIRNLEHQGNIAAKLRYESRLHGQHLVGLGFYWQRGDLGKRLTRWEMQTQIADQTASFVQVYDGDHLWTDQGFPSGRQVHRLDVPWLQTKLHATNRGKTVGERDQVIAGAEGQGGLGQMLGDLLRNFDFQPPQPTQLNGLPVNALVGQWRPEQLVRLWPGAAQLGADEPPEWPEQIPHHVLLLVGSNMFPYVCEHRSAADAPLATSLAGLRPAREPLLRYEVFEVNFAVAIPAEKFVYLPPDDVDWTDETALVLEQLTQASVVEP